MSKLLSISVFVAILCCSTAEAQNNQFSASTNCGIISSVAFIKSEGITVDQKEQNQLQSNYQIKQGREDIS